MTRRVLEWAGSCDFTHCCLYIRTLTTLYNTYFPVSYIA